MKIVKTHSVIGNELCLSDEKCNVILQFGKRGLLCFHVVREGNRSTTRLPVIRKPITPEQFKLDTLENKLIVHVDGFIYHINLNPFYIELTDTFGNLLWKTANGRTFDYRDDQICFRFELKDEEEIYGLGQDPMAHVNHRGFERRMWNMYGSFRHPGNAGIPFFCSSSGYGALLANTNPARFAIDEALVAERPNCENWAPAPWRFDDHSGENVVNEMAIILDDTSMELYIFCGENLDAIQQRYHDLTGPTPLLPLWAYGYIQSKNRYRNRDEVVHIANQYREKGIPCDALVIDWQWYTKVGDLDWDEKAWGNAKEMNDRLKDMGFHVMLAQHPFIEPGCKNYDEFEREGFLNKLPEPSDFQAKVDSVLESGMPTFDFSNSAAQMSWWNKIHKLANDGVDGYWTDMGELQDHPVGMSHYAGNREQVHNLYTYYWSKALYEGHRSSLHTRCVSLHRSACAGSHSNAAILWSGDIACTWDVLRDHIRIGQGVVLSGQPYWCTDIGGFFESSEFTGELYVRWLQWGVFCPIFRTHGTRYNNEPWGFGKQNEEIIKSFIKLRYRLLPYIYTCARQVYDSGKSIMRAMAMDYPQDSRAREAYGQYMFGDSILVCPVTDYQARSWTVYLPEGGWYDLFTNEYYVGGCYLTVAAALDKIPVFVREGSIIPTAIPRDNASETMVGNIYVRTYGADCKEYLFYLDSGDDYGYEEGQYSKWLFSCKGGVLKTELCNHSNNIGLNKEFIHEPIAKNECIKEKISWDVDIEQSGVYHGNMCFQSFPSGSILQSIELTYKPGSFADVVMDDLPMDISSTFTIFTIAMKATPQHWSPALEVGIKAKLLFKGKLREVCFNNIVWSENIPIFDIIGSFPNNNLESHGLDYDFGVEKDPTMNSIVYQDKEYNWQRSNRLYTQDGYVEFPRPPKKPVFNSVVCEGVAYARGKISSLEEQEVYMQICAEPAVKVWINGDLMYRDTTVVINKVLDRPVLLKRGMNHVLVKSAVRAVRLDSAREFGFQISFIDKNGEPVRTIEVEQ